MKARSIAIAVIIAGIGSANIAAQAGPNDFFGSQLSGIGGSPDVTQGAQGSTNGVAGVGAGAAASGVPAGSAGGAGGGDYTVDEKRVQKKYKENVKRCEKLITRGTDMMKSGDEKTAKKGKVLKDIGERALAELKSNNPFPEIADSGKKKIH